MENELLKIKNEALEKIEACTSLKELNDIRVLYLGKKGPIQEAMKSLMKNKTCSIIAHRLSTIKNADNILVLNNGDIVENGNHQTLMKKKGIYYSLYNSQFD